MLRRGWHHRGYLPHLDAEGEIQHLVFRLADSLPNSVIETLRLTDPDEARKQVDQALDAGHGAALLADHRAAQIVANAVRWGEGDRYELFAWCVMPNHVHAVIRPNGEHALGAVVKSWKAYSASKINRELGRSGSLWAPDYFDRFMRDNDQLSTTIAYVEMNPVKAGLCGVPQAWQFSSAYRGKCGPEGPRSD